MKFMQNNLAKKLIIVLIVLLLFNAVYPSMSYSVDLGGILLQPIYWLLLGIYVPADIIFGATIYLKDMVEGTADNLDSWKDLLIGPDTIFVGDIPALNANIFNYTTGHSILTNVSKAVAKFYVILRNIAAIVMLAGLIFTGIRILLSANIPTKKTQYLMLLQDWLIGFALLIFSHIIMILIMQLAETITEALKGTLSEGSIKYQLYKGMLSWDSTKQITALLLYHWVQILTIIFAIAYFKRYFWTCILVVFAPVFCVMYAFGQQTKQIYTNWFKEFIMNAMIQPFHLVVYTVLIGMPMAMGRIWLELVLE